MNHYVCYGYIRHMIHKVGMRERNVTLRAQSCLKWFHRCRVYQFTVSLFEFVPLCYSFWEESVLIYNSVTLYGFDYGRFVVLMLLSKSLDLYRNGKRTCRLVGSMNLDADMAVINKFTPLNKNVRRSSLLRSCSVVRLTCSGTIITADETSCTANGYL